MITISNVTRRFGSAVAVSDASLSVAAGESLALWGANGAGKTTLLRCVLGLLRFRGAITVGGRDVRRDPKSARLLIGYVPQELAFHDELGVSEAVTYFARLKGLRSPRVGAVLESVGLADHHRKRVRELSGGMKQRLALAIALLADPPVLVLDEVTASLDAVGRSEFVGLLERLRSKGRTMLFASHRVEEVAALAQRVAMLDKGRITEVLATSEFVQRAGRDATLHIRIDPSRREHASRTLREAGFDPRLNGVGLLVPVQPSQKAAPFRVLAEAKIPVEDFDIVGPIAADHHAITPQQESNT